MNFAFSEEQEELRRYASRWLTERSPSKTVRELMDSDEGFDRGQWAETAEMGWHGMAIPEEYGGAGFGFLELMVLMEEQGKALWSAPFFSTVVLAANALLIAGSDEQKKTWLPRIASGELVATLATTEPNGRWDADGVEAVATRTGAGWEITGTKRYVLDGHTADVVIVAARTDAGVSLFLVPGTTEGVTREVLETMDATRKQAEIGLDSVIVEEGALVGVDGEGWKVVDEVMRIGAVALSVEAVGGAQRCLDMAVEYAKDRHQFGRPIGSFQSIKHKCADMLVAVESAKAAAYYAAWAVSESNDEVPLVAPLAKSYCTEAFYHCASENIQIHGGIGFTWEHDAHLYFKRAKSSELLFGKPSEHRRVLAERLGL